MRLQQMIIGMMLLLSFGVSQAGEARHYFGVSSESYSLSGLSAISYKYGYDFSNLLSAEVDYSQTDLSAATATVLTADSVTNVMLHLNRRYESINAYFAIGYGSATMTQVGLPFRSAFNGLSYGVGMELYGSKNTAISFSWLRRVDIQGDIPTDTLISELDSVQVGLVHHFDFAKTSSRY